MGALRVERGAERVWGVRGNKGYKRSLLRNRIGQRSVKAQRNCVLSGAGGVQGVLEAWRVTVGWGTSVCRSVPFGGC